MIKYSKAFIFWGSLMLSLSALSVGYGFWTDHLDLKGDADVKLSINVIDDVVLVENITEEAIQITPEAIPPDSGGGGEVEFIDAPSVVEENPDTAMPEADDTAGPPTELPAEPTIEPSTELPAEPTIEPPTELPAEPTIEPPAEPPVDPAIVTQNFLETDQNGEPDSSTGKDIVTTD